jgi:transcriptional regulator of acetoin/glycerol metabolism
MADGADQLTDLRIDRSITTLRPVIASSWERCLSIGLAPDRYQIFNREVDTQSAFVHAAGPVVAHVHEDLASLEVSVFVTDDHANTVLRADAGQGIGRKVERLGIVVGASFAEETMGTNAIGTALTAGGATLVAGGEHFADAIGSFTCAASPIRDRRLGRIVGVLDLTCDAEDGNPLMVGLARTAAREIELSLDADTSSPAGRAAMADWQKLTSAEQSVAALVIQGYSNKQVAEMLFCSPYTVDGHLRSIFRKLEVRSRTALARRVALVPEHIRSSIVE